jgi:hypothetical protein
MTAFAPRAAVRRMARFFRRSLHTPKPLDGQISKKLSSPVVKNNPLSLSGKSSLQARSVPTRQEGRHAIVTAAGRDAVDADDATDESTGCGRRSRVVLTPRRWRQVGERQLSPMTVANKPGHRGEHEGNR